MTSYQHLSAAISDQDNPDIFHTDSSSSKNNQLQYTPLYMLHRSHRASMTEFAGFYMPVYYEGEGALVEHLHTRSNAGLFDVSHMGQLRFTGESYDEVAKELELLIPCDLASLTPGELKYALLLKEDATITDDLIVGRGVGETQDTLFVVVNASRVANDVAHFQKYLHHTTLIQDEHLALLALQGPKAHGVLSNVIPHFPQDMPFMTQAFVVWDGIHMRIARCGYTGEDGYEISIPSQYATVFAERLLQHTHVKLIGLGARDSLRLEAGLCLYGHDISESNTPLDADLMWTIPKPRRERMDFLGAQTLMQQMKDGPRIRRCGFVLESQPPAREGDRVVSSTNPEDSVGRITSGLYSPSLQKPIAMGYIQADMAKRAVRVHIQVRKHLRPASVVSMPFLEKKYVK